MFVSSIQGMRSSIEMLNRSAQNLQDFEKADVPKEMTEMIVAEDGFRANLVVLNTAIRMQQSIIDLLA